MAKLHLGKTATSRTRRKKVIEQVSAVQPPDNDFITYLLGKGYSDTTAESFYNDLKKFQGWLVKQELEIENVQYNDMTAYLQSIAHLSQHTKGCYLRGIKHYFNYLITCNERTHNPVEFIQLKGIKRKKLYDILNRSELDRLYSSYTLPDQQDKNKNQNWFALAVLAQKRNKVILGLMLYQGLDSRDLKLLTIHDVKLQEGKIFIPGTRRSNERELKLESLQILELMEYLLTIRKELLMLTGKQTDQLFISAGSSERFHNILVYLVKRLRTINTKVTSVKQIKASVIVHWLKIYNLRQVQYMAGHRYVSSTESFLMNEMDGMIEDIDKYHPTI
jgi:site-specific recombinase XerD